MRQPPRRRKLTDLFVRTVEPEAKRAVYWDTLQTGPGLKVQPTGTKTFVAVYRHAGKPRWYVLGGYSRIGLKEARKGAKEVTARAMLGQDPH